MADPKTSMAWSAAVLLMTDPKAWDALSEADRLAAKTVATDTLKAQARRAKATIQGNPEEDRSTGSVILRAKGVA